MSDKKAIAWTLIFFALSLAGILRHEVWLDEAHHWLISRDSRTINELLAATRPDGHPVLWNFLLFLIAKFTHDVAAMQIFHVLISSSAVFVWLRKAPFPTISKVLFIFGYFMFFEYNLLSRNYALGILALFIACNLEREKNFIGYCLMLGLAMNTHLMFAVIAVALVLVSITQANKRPAAGYAIFGTALLLLMLQIGTTSSGWFFEAQQMGLAERFEKGFVSMLKGVVIIPDFTTLHWWNSNLIVNLSRPIAIVLCLALYFLPLLLFKKRNTLLFVYLALFGAQIFFFVTQRGAVRFYGLSFLILVIAYWLEPQDKAGSSGLARYRNQIGFFILIVHFASGITAYASDFAQPFHNGKLAARFAATNFPNVPIISFTCDGTVISAYSEQKFWMACHGRMASYCDWQSPCDQFATPGDAREALANYATAHPRGIYISYLSPFANASGKWHQLGANAKTRFLAAFDNGAILKDKFYVWEVKSTE